ncbi:MAG: DNA primase [Chloroflexi bacterium]|nr:DNA primase [Chloroflexota bacterium]
MSAIDDIKQRLDIVDITGSYLRLDKAGRNFKALCPFHQEKTPSFFIFPDRQSWRCFGCGAGGDVFAFVMKKEGIDFGETLKLLADKAGVSLERKKEIAESKLTDRLYQINETAAQYYYRLLIEAPEAGAARDYAMKKRGLARNTVDDFKLGFSSGEGLKKYLAERGYNEKELLTLRLIGEKDGRIYDFFRHRLMFPILDIKGRVVGFGGRALDDSQPKYLNSPQTPIFDKSSILYGIDRAKGTIRDKKLAVIVEGYMDVITAHQYGYTNVVGSMGTALTEKQLNILKKLTRSIAFALDPDTAGDAATLRAIEVARRSLDRDDLEMPTWLGTTSRLKADMKIIPLPKGKDPDVLIKEEPELWSQLVENALPLMDHILAVTASRLDLSKPEEKSRASEQLLPLIAELDDDVQREYYLGKLAGLLGISEKTLVGIAARLHRSRRDKIPKAETKAAAPSYFGDRLEEYTLSLLLQHHELRDKVKELSPEHFERTENREIFTIWSMARNIDELLDKLNVDLREHLSYLQNRALPPATDKDRERALIDCILRLEERKLLNLKIQEESLLSDAEFEGRKEDIAALQQRGVEINLKLKETFENAMQMTSSYREEQ